MATRSKTKAAARRANADKRPRAVARERDHRPLRHFRKAEVRERRVHARADVRPRVDDDAVAVKHIHINHKGIVGIPRRVRKGLAHGRLRGPWNATRIWNCRTTPAHHGIRNRGRTYAGTDSPVARSRNEQAKTAVPRSSTSLNERQIKISILFVTYPLFVKMSARPRGRT